MYNIELFYLFLLIPGTVLAMNQYIVVNTNTHKINVLNGAGMDDLSPTLLKENFF
jgi:hypothetical protein